MIATILPSSVSFHAVLYNESKVANGSAFLMEIKNFGGLSIKGYKKPEQLVDFLKLYSSANDRIKKPQFHMAFSCKGDEKSYEELLDFAHQYLREMGYGEDGQPLLAYGHRDTDNNHIHIITSRVRPDGKKIDHNNDYRRSQKVIEKLLGNNEKQSLEDKLTDIEEFNYRSLTQYRAILEAMGYDCYEKDNKLNIKKGGMVLKSLDTNMIIKQAEWNKKSFDDSGYNKLFGIISKYRDLNSDIDGLRKDLRKKFGLELVFFGRKDSPYGYVIVDFHNKCVYEGSKVMKIKRLTEFQTPEQRKNKIDQYIINTINNNPGIMQKELNKKLKRLNAYISKGEYHIGGKSYPLSDNIKETLATNDKLEWVNSFNPRNDDEFETLLKFAGLDKSKIKFPDSYNYIPYDKNLVNNLHNIFGSDDIDKIKTDLSNAGYRLIKINGKEYIYSSRDKAMVNLERINIKLPQSKSDKLTSPASSPNVNLKKPKLNTSGDNSHGTNREWEVGTKGKWDDDDGRQLKY